MYVNLFKVNKPLSALRFRHVFLKEQETISLKYNHFGNIPCRREWQPTAVFLPGEFHGQSSLAVYCLWGHKELVTTEQVTLYLSKPLLAIKFRHVFLKNLEAMSLKYNYQGRKCHCQTPHSQSTSCHEDENFFFLWIKSVN